MSKSTVQEPTFPQSINECIYCGNTNELSDEHIIPYSLGGEWELKNASCVECCKATTLIERHIAREHLLAFRTAAQLPTYRPKKRPKTLNQKVSGVGGTTIISLMPAQHPASLVLPIFEPPGHLSGRAAGPFPLLRSVRVISRGAKVRSLSKSTSADGFTVPVPDRGLFPRFLAKVAVGFAVGCVGVNGLDEIFVLDTILGKRADAGRWVGGTHHQPIKAGSGVHELTSTVENGILSVTVRLFSFLNTPEYSVIVGRLAR